MCIAPQKDGDDHSKRFELQPDSNSDNQNRVTSPDRAPPVRTDSQNLTGSQDQNQSSVSNSLPVITSNLSQIKINVLFIVSSLSSLLFIIVITQLLLFNYSQQSTTTVTLGEYHVRRSGKTFLLRLHFLLFCFVGELMGSSADRTHMKMNLYDNYTIINDAQEGSGSKRGTRIRNKRSIVQLFGMMNCVGKCDPLSYKSYGCYCGYLGEGKPVNGIDK